MSPAKIIVLLMAFLLACPAAFADLAVDPGSIIAGSQITSSQLNNRYSPLYNTVNGLLSNVNIKAGAAIDPAKLDFTKQIGPILRAAANNCFAAGTTGDTEPRTAITSDGAVLMGAGGASAVDLRFKRTDATTFAFRNAADDADTHITAGNGTFSGTLGVTGTASFGSSTFSTLPTLPNAATDTALLGPVNSTTGAAPAAAAPTVRAIDPRDIPNFRNDIKVSTSSTNPDYLNSGNTLYISNCGGNQITLYNTTQGKWITQTFAQISLAVPATSDSNYDLFVTSASATTISASTVQWTNDTTRASAIALVNGRWVKASDHSQLLVATFRTLPTIGTTGISVSTEGYYYIDNVFNHKPVNILVSGAPAASWTYVTTTYRGINASTNYRQHFVFATGRLVSFAYKTEASHSAATPAQIKVGVEYNTLGTATGAPILATRADTAAASDIIPLEVQLNLNLNGAVSGTAIPGYGCIIPTEAAAGATTTFYGTDGSIVITYSSATYH